MAIGEAIEAELGNRQGQRTDMELPENFPEVPKGDTRDLAAKAAGFGNGKTYEQAKRAAGSPRHRRYTQRLHSLMNWALRA